MRARVAFYILVVSLWAGLFLFMVWSIRDTAYHLGYLDGVHAARLDRLETRVLSTRPTLKVYK